MQPLCYVVTNYWELLHNCYIYNSAALITHESLSPLLPPPSRRRRYPSGQVLLDERTRGRSKVFRVPPHPEDTFPPPPPPTMIVESGREGTLTSSALFSGRPASLHRPPRGKSASPRHAHFFFFEPFCFRYSPREGSAQVQGPPPSFHRRQRWASCSSIFSSAVARSKQPHFGGAVMFCPCQAVQICHQERGVRGSSVTFGLF